MELVSVIIINWNRKIYLTNCVTSVLQQSYTPIEIVVVDNGSQDGSAEIMKENFAQVKLIINERNELYCRAQNQGINKAKGQYIICLNNDAVLEKNFVEELLKAAAREERIGMVCGKIMSMDKVHIDSAGQLLARSRRPKERGYKKKDRRRFDNPGYIFSAGGVAPLYKRKMLEEVKIGEMYFDESYGMFYEDLDIAWRANLLGWRGFYNPGAVAYHKRGATAKTHTPRLAFLKSYDFAYLSPQLKVSLVKNRYMTIIKNDSPKSFLINLPFILGYEIKLWSYIIFLNPRLLLKLIKNMDCLKTAFKKRKIIQKGVKDEAKEI